MMSFLLRVRVAVWTGAAVRVLAMVILLIVPDAFPLRDYYEGTREPSASIVARALHRPQMFPLAEDELAYDELARSILSGGGYVLNRTWVITQPGEPTAYGGALYPLFVAAIYAVANNAFVAVVMVQIALSVAVIAGVARITAIVAGDRAALAAAWLCAVHPGLVMAPSLLMTEALSIPIVVGIVLAGLRWLEAPSPRIAALMGTLVGLGFLIRSPLGLAGVAAVGVLLELLRRRKLPESLFKQALTAAIACTVVLTPWTVRNWVEFGRVLPADSKSGVNLWMYNRTPGSEGWANIQGMDEGAVDRMYRERAVQNIRAHPGWFARETLLRSVQFWWRLPRNVPTPLHWIGIAVYLAMTVAAVLGLAIMMGGLPRRETLWMVVVPILVGWGLMAITTAGLRHRLTTEPLLVVAAAVVLSRVAASRRIPDRAPSST